MLPFLIVLAAFILLLAAIDIYVYRNWRAFVRTRDGRGSRLLRWTLPIYLALVPLMALLLPATILLSNWWEVEPKLLRGVTAGAWIFYYLPKVFIAIVLLVKDVVRGGVGIFGRVRRRSRRQESPAVRGEDGAVDQQPAADSGAMQRREFLRKLGWSAAVVPYATVGYGVFRSVYDFEVIRVDVPLPDLPAAFDGMTIAQISDIHAGSFFSGQPMMDVADIIERLRPDMIAITGDFVNNDVAELPLVLPSLNRLNAPLGVYGCLGNHDHYARVDQVAETLQTTPLQLLVNEHLTLNIDGASLHLIGTDNTGFRQNHGDLPRAVSGIQPNDNGEEARILLAHDPTFWDGHVRPSDADIDLMLCGHTHGGQIGIELGPLRWGLAQPFYDRWAGLYREPRPTGGDQFLYVNRGVGTTGPPIRLGIHPEVTLLKLVRG